MRLDGLAARVRARVPPAVVERLLAAWGAARRRPEVLLAAALVGGVAVMILHWS